MNLDNKLAQKLNSDLKGDTFDTSKDDKKNKNQLNNETLPKNQHQLVFTYEKRKGKPVTLVGRFYLHQKEKKELLKLLKKKLACGGAIKEEWIEIQGNVKDKIKTILQQDGWKFKK